MVLIANNTELLFSLSIRESLYYKEERLLKATSLREIIKTCKIIVNLNDQGVKRPLYPISRYVKSTTF